jgi:uncharacterized protein involved in exopolysaccharide biosynthesis
MTPIDTAELRRLLAEATAITWVEAAAKVWAALPALLDRVEAAEAERDVLAEELGPGRFTAAVERLTQDLRAERDQLRTDVADLLAGADADGFELTRLSAQMAELEDAIARCGDREQVRVRCERLEAALRKHGAHGGHCPLWGDGDGPCTCGLDAALEEP